MMLTADLMSSGPGGDRKPISVQRPSDYAGVGAALREAFVTPPVPQELVRLLARLK